MRFPFLITLILTIGLPHHGRAESSGLYRPVDSEDTLNYLLHLPAGYETSSESYPLLLFLHGIAQKGNGSVDALQKVAVDGPFRAMRDGDWDETLPLIVVGPQSGGLQPWWRGDEVRRVFEHVRRTYRTDTTRIYLSGISMGGRSAWWLAKNYSSEFAAMVATSGWAGDVSRSCEAFRHLAVWAFHGRNDPLIGVSAGRKPVAALSECEPAFSVAPRITLLDAGHGRWNLVYANRHADINLGGDGRSYSDIYRWMLSFQQNQPGR